MPKYYCDYCDTYLTHDSPSVRKTHCYGRKHKDNVRDYYQNWLDQQVQKLVDQTTAQYTLTKMTPGAPGGPASIMTSPLGLGGPAGRGMPMRPPPFPMMPMPPHLMRPGAPMGMPPMGMPPMGLPPAMMPPPRSGIMGPPPPGMLPPPRL